MPVYNPNIFDQPNLERARAIILTPEAGMTPAQRWESETPYILDIVRTFTEAEDTILDFGCGIGRMAPLALDRTLIGVDMSPQMRKFAAAAYAGMPRMCLMSDLAFEGLAARADLRLDAVLALWVIQHVADPVKALDMIRHTLRPGGRLFLLNRNRRCVPTYDAGWWDDGHDVFEIAAGSGLRAIHEKRLPPGLNPAESRFVILERE